MVCVCFYIGCFYTIFRLLLLFVILFESKTASPTILNTASIGEQDLLTFTRQTKGKYGKLIHWLINLYDKLLTILRSFLRGCSYGAGLAQLTGMICLIKLISQF
jgi:hypothetical protein